MHTISHFTLDQQKIYELIRKYQNDTATEAEKQALIEWYRAVANQDATFPDDENEVGDFMHNRLMQEIRPVKSNSKRRNWAVAASVLVLFSLGLLWFARNTTSLHANQQAVTRINKISPGGNKAILTLADGSKISLTDAGTGHVADQQNIKINKSANGQLVYTIADYPNNVKSNGAGSHAVAIQYNTIETPAGGQYQVILPDGTHVWLNAKSALKYPASFAALKERRVELSGEAYFEVAHNKEIPFRVHSGTQLVEVLGTHFNVNAYPDDTQVKTTLLEGSVKLTAASGNALLKPNQQAELREQFHVSTVNAKDAIAWKDGYFRFDEERLETIMKVVARWYNVNVVYEDERIKNDRFGVLSTRFASISTLLGIMEKTGNVEFQIYDSTIRIKRKK
jgi:transmembrane sensor